MDKSGDYGIIINIGSITGHSVPNIPGFKLNVYPGTKYAVRATTEVIRLELLKRNNKKIRVAVSIFSLNIESNEVNEQIYFLQEVSPGGVLTEIQEAGGFVKPGEKPTIQGEQDFPMLRDADVSEAVGFLLTTPYSVNITEIVIKPTGEMI